ncbi:hypothetical protein [Gluconobacter wancherniae]|nr:hypothetical protein [Gluconobacter wancherniae]GBD56596.1 hypothetical protein NBRC103581_01175 [Gluconobacter wancherniae NBRC 103581]
MLHPHHERMVRQEGASPSPKKRKVIKLANRLGASATTCILDVLVNDRPGLMRDSAVFMDILEKIWKVCDVEASEVWAELDHRLKLAEDMRATGTRVRKGGRIRSTKLP